MNMLRSYEHFPYGREGGGGGRVRGGAQPHSIPFGDAFPHNIMMIQIRLN